MRFEHDMHSEPFTSENVSTSGSRVIACRTLTDWRYRVQQLPDENESSLDESNYIC